MTSPPLFSRSFPRTFPKSGRSGDEANFSAQRPQARPHPWLPRPHGDEERPQDHQSPPRERPSSADSSLTPPPVPQRAGFPRQRRLLTKAAYAAVFAEPERRSSAHFSLLFRFSPARFARLGLAISRRQAPTAVERNRIKRLVRESFRLRAGAMPSFDVVVMLRTSTSGTPAVVLRDELALLWNRLPKGKPAV